MQAKAQRHGEEAEEAQRKFEGAQKLVEKLKAQLEVQRTRVRASPRKVINYIKLDKALMLLSSYRKVMKPPKTRLLMKSP